MAKDLLFVFDETLLQQEALPTISAGTHVRLLSLTSRPEAARSAGRRLGAAGARVEELPSGRLVNAAAAEIRQPYIEFIADLPRRCLEVGVDIKSLFAVDAHASLWWFSLVAEKNTVKSDAFHKLAQAEAVLRAARECPAAEVWLCLGHLRLTRVLISRLEAAGVKVAAVRRPGWRGVLESPIGLYLYAVQGLLRCAWHRLLRSRRVRAVLGVPARGGSTPLLFVTYYPHLDRELAEKGVFRNRYCIPLQESLEGAGAPTTWLALSAPSQEASYADSLRWAAGFRGKGTDFWMLEQFAGFRSPVLAVWEMLCAGWRFHRLQPAIARACLWEGVSLFPILAREWYDSFAGVAGFEGIWFYQAFREVLRHLAPEQALYYQEMHAWEKALIAANADCGGRTRLLGYQHATTPWMLLNYANPPSELNDRGPYPLPQPGLILCGGEASRRHMRGCGWPADRLRVVEALRFAHLNGHRGRSRDKGSAVLIPLSIGVVESAAILNMAREALRDIPGIEVWVKPHPFLPMEKVWERSGLSARAPGWSVVSGPVEPMLEKARVVIVGESGVALEALALDCRVVVVHAPELVSTSPLWGRDGALLASADSSAALRSAVLHGLGPHPGAAAREAAWRIVDDFFCFADGGGGAPRMLDILLNKDALVTAGEQGECDG